MDCHKIDSITELTGLDSGDLGGQARKYNLNRHILMKRIIVTMMVAMAALIAAPAIAQTSTTPVQEQTCQKKGKQCKGHKRGVKGKKGKKGHRKGSEGPAFRGVEMTAAQQARIDTIYSQARSDFKVSCCKAREAMINNIDQRVQEVLTPEQYTIYKGNRDQMSKGRKNKHKPAACSAEGCAKSRTQGASTGSR